MAPKITLPKVKLTCDTRDKFDKTKCDFLEFLGKMSFQGCVKCKNKLYAYVQI